MTLVIQVAGALLLGALLGTSMLGGGMHRTVAGVTILAIAATGIAFWSGVWSTGRMFVEQAGTYPSVHEANVTPGSLFPADEGLLSPVESVIPRNASVYLICEPGAAGCSGEWISYQLSPRLFVEKIQEAQYILVYGTSPTKVGAAAHLHVLLNRSDGGVVRRGTA